MFSGDLRVHSPDQPEPMDGRGFRRHWEKVTTALPDLRFELDEVVAAGDLVVARWKAPEAHEGGGVDVFRFEDGKIAEVWTQPALLGGLQQARYNADLVSRGVEEIWNRHNFESAPEFYSPDLIVNTFQEPEPLRGLAEYREHHQHSLTSYPDLHMEIQDVFADERMVAIRMTMSGTDEGGGAGGMPATGEKFAVTILAHFRMGDGKVQEMWTLPDVVGLMAALGFGAPPKAVIAVMGAMKKIGSLRPGGKDDDDADN